MAHQKKLFLQISPKLTRFHHGDLWGCGNQRWVAGRVMVSRVQKRVEGRVGWLRVERWGGESTGGWEWGKWWFTGGEERIEGGVGGSGWDSEGVKSGIATTSDWERYESGIVTTGAWELVEAWGERESGWPATAGGLDWDLKHWVIGGVQGDIQHGTVCKKVQSKSEPPWPSASIYRYKVLIPCSVCATSAMWSALQAPSVNTNAHMNILVELIQVSSSVRSTSWVGSQHSREVSESRVMSMSTGETWRSDW